ncbi:HAD-IA family hydrolase [Natronorubrum sp. JWXQ-INN-674]|uniref:HAD-IA family hydrolase n=1 Tax=Natronorubrum halalkaliphilum TaxID=2691917 RepID=A0A6B0VSC5_9EURY|nr:HAD family hydrolase [Natronorubrum halalkaliphilum]MXV64448.1 HAD-IA family hydrolase [Natronorubrum halalkaliphilum]
MTAIVFDLDGTLLHTDEPYQELLAGAISDVRGSKSVPKTWLETYEEAFFELFSACEPDPVRRAFARIDGCSDPDAYATALLEREIESLSPPANARADLERLRETHELGVLTNGVRDWQLAKLRAHDLADAVDAVVASYEVGAHKPNAPPYRALEKRLPATQYGMVGDSDGDIDGAENAGWETLRYDGGGFGGLPDDLFLH